MNSSLKRALISVSDKTDIATFATHLRDHGFEIISTGGTATALRKEGLRVIDVSAVTHFPEILDGRVKTLHPNIHAGILADRSDSRHIETLRSLAIEPFDIIVVNLYPFERTVMQDPEDHELIIENIDIGGPSMIRAAAKNYRHTAIVTDTCDYARIIDLLERENGVLPESFRFELAMKAFQHTAYYDAVIADYFYRQHAVRSHTTPGLPSGLLTIPFRHESDLRYGENPHQKAARYVVPLSSKVSVLNARVHGGLEMSFNNILDAQAAWDVAGSFDEAAVAIIKHQTPCGAASANNLADAYRRAYDSDPVSAYGGIAALNQSVTMDVAQLLNETPFLEVIIAPDYPEESLKLLLKKKNRRILSMPPDLREQTFDLRFMGSGALIQERDRSDRGCVPHRVVTNRAPTSEELRDLDFAWRIVRHVKSNAIVCASNGATVGIGGGQVSRVDSVTIACTKGGQRVRGAVLASDAFFPFRDGIDHAARHGVTAVIQPGGSKRDDEVIAACNEQGIAMIFTDKRHFRH